MCPREHQKSNVSVILRFVYVFYYRFRLFAFYARVRNAIHRVYARETWNANDRKSCRRQSELVPAPSMDV